MAEEAATERIAILLQAKDRQFAAAMERNNRLIAKLARDGDRQTAKLQRNMSRNFDKAGSDVIAFGKSFALGLAGGVVAAAFAGITTNIAGLLASLGDLQDAADRIGLNVEDLQGLQVGFLQAGVATDISGKALETFSQRLGEAAQGSGELFKLLARSGIALRDTQGNLRPVVDLLRDVAGVIGGAGSEQEALALASDAFGRSGRAMALALQDGRGSVDAMIDSAREAGLVMDESLIKRAADLDARFELLTLKLGTMFKTAAVNAAEFFSLSQTGTDLLIEKFGTLERAQAALGDGAASFNDETLVTPGQAETVDELVYAYDSLARSYQAMRSALVGDVGALLDLGAEDAALALDAVISQMDQLQADFDAGTIKAEAFEAGLAAAADEAIRALNEAQAINGLDVSGAVAAVGALQSALALATRVARALRAALPGGTPDPSGPESLPTVTDSDGSSVSGFDPDPNAPSTRPRAAPNDIDFDLPPVGRGGGGGGGGGGRDSDDFIGARMDAAQASAEAARIEARSILMSAEAIAREKARIDLLIEAKRRKLDLDKRSTETGRTLREEIDLQAAAIGQLTAATARYEERASYMAEQQRTLKDGFLDAVFEGKKFADVLESVGRALARAALEAALFGSGPFGGGRGGGGIGGIFGPILGGLFGGMRATSGPGLLPMAPGRAMPAAAMAGAPPAPQVRVEVAASPYFDVRVQQVAGTMDAQIARAQRRALPGEMRIAQTRGLR